MGQGGGGRAEDTVLHYGVGILRSLPGSFGGCVSLFHLAHSPNQVKLDSAAMSLCVLPSTRMCLG